MSLQFRRNWPLFLSILFVLTVQLIQINRPYRGHFASYQGTVMASIARNMLEENFGDIFIPKTDGLMLSSDKTYHLNQYPLPSLFVAAAIKLFGGSFEFWGRFQAIIFNLLSVFFFWAIVRKITDETTATLSSILFMLSPYAILYGQTFFCEPIALCCLLASLLLVLSISPERKNGLRLASAAVLFSVVLVSRIHFLLFLPAMIFGVWRASRSIKAMALFFFLSFLLPFFWYGFTYYASLRHIMRTHTSLFFQAAATGLGGRSLIFSPEYWKRIFDIGALNILTPLAFPFLLLGLITAFQDVRKFGVMLLMCGCGFLTVFLFPHKIMDHDFYLYGLLPPLVFFAAIGIRATVSQLGFLKRGSVILLALLCFMAVSARYFLHPMFSCSPQERKIAETGAWIRAKTRPEDVLIFAGPDTPALSFYADRRSFEFSLDGKHQLPDYIKNRKFDREGSAAIVALEAAMKDDVSLLEFYRSKGAVFMFFSNRSEAERNPALFQYLRKHYSELSPKDAAYYFFKL